MSTNVLKADVEIFYTSIILILPLNIFPETNENISSLTYHASQFRRSYVAKVNLIVLIWETPQKRTHTEYNKSLINNILKKVHIHLWLCLLLKSNHLVLSSYLYGIDFESQKGIRHYREIWHVYVVRCVHMYVCVCGLLSIERTNSDLTMIRYSKWILGVCRLKNNHLSMFGLVEPPKSTCFIYSCI